MHTTIKSGLPCIARVTYCSAGRAGRVHGDPDDCYEAEPPELEFALFTTTGKRATWMEKQMSDADYLRISRELLERTQ
jgi:hypothetical protein